MKGDFSRDTFRPGLQYTRVLAQQGRVDLDADRNEAQAILLERLRWAIVDHFGPFGGPEFLYDSDGTWGRANEGFLVGVEPDGANIHALTVGAGRYYVDGWACVSVGGRYAVDDDQPAPPLFPEDLLTATPFFVYLDVWERHRTSLDDESIAEVALNGIDTATRAELVCQVRFLVAADIPGATPLANFTVANRRDWWPEVLERLRGANVGRLKARAQRPDAAGDNPCLAGAGASYTGPENQLYRVEIHEGGDATQATFKFSGHNGSVVATLEEITPKLLTMKIGSRSVGLFSAGNWVEIVDDGREALALPGTLVKVLKVEGAEVTIDPASANGTLDPNAFAEPKVRRWDQTGKGPLTLKGGAIEVLENEWIPLEHGIEVMFENGGGRIYRSGDYWTLPARYLTGDIEWEPEDTFLPPQGVQHYYAPLAAVNAVGNVVDLRLLKDPWA
jgi:hypothetical protein